MSLSSHLSQRDRDDRVLAVLLAKDSELASQQARIEELIRERDEWEEKYAKEKQANRQLNERVTKMQRELDELKQSSRVASSSSSHHPNTDHSRFAKMEEELHRKSEQIEELIRTVAEERQRSQHHQQKSAAANSSSLGSSGQQEWLQEREEMASLILDQQQRLETFEMRCKQMEEEQGKYQTQVQQLRQQLASASGGDPSIAPSSSSVSSLNTSSICSTPSSHPSAHSQAHATHNSSLSSISTTSIPTPHIPISASQLASFERDIHALRSQLVERERELQTVRGELVTLQREQRERELAPPPTLEKTSAILTQKQKEIEELRRVNDELRQVAQYQRVSEVSAAAAAASSHASNTGSGNIGQVLDNLRAQLLLAQSELASKTHALSVAALEARELHSRQSQTEEQMARLKAALQTSEKKEHDLQTRLTALHTLQAQSELDLHRIRELEFQLRECQDRFKHRESEWLTERHQLESQLRDTHAHSQQALETTHRMLHAMMRHVSDTFQSPTTHPIMEADPEWTIEMKEVHGEFVEIVRSIATLLASRDLHKLHAVQSEKRVQLLEHELAEKRSEEVTRLDADQRAREEREREHAAEARQHADALEALDHRLAREKSEVRRLEHEVTRAERETVACQEQVAACEKKCELLEQRVKKLQADAKTQSSQATLERHAANEQLVRSQELLKEKEQQNQVLVQTLEALQHAQLMEDKAAAAAAAARTGVSKPSTSSLSSSSSSSPSPSSSHSLSSQLLTFSAQLSHARAQESLMRRSLKLAELSVRAKVEYVTELESEVDSLRHVTVPEYERALTSAQTRDHAARLELDRCQARVTRLNEEVASLHSQLQASDTRHAQLRAQLEANETELVATRKRHVSELMHLHEQTRKDVEQIGKQLWERIRHESAAGVASASASSGADVIRGGGGSTTTAASASSSSSVSTTATTGTSSISTPLASSNEMHLAIKELTASIRQAMTIVAAAAAATQSSHAQVSHHDRASVNTVLFATPTKASSKTHPASSPSFVLNSPSSSVVAEVAPSPNEHAAVLPAIVERLMNLLLTTEGEWRREEMRAKQREIQLERMSHALYAKVDELEACKQKYDLYATQHAKLLAILNQKSEQTSQFLRTQQRQSSEKLNALHATLFETQNTLLTAQAATRQYESQVAQLRAQCNEYVRQLERQELTSEMKLSQHGAQVEHQLESRWIYKEEELKRYIEQVLRPLIIAVQEGNDGGDQASMATTTATSSTKSNAANQQLTVLTNTIASLKLIESDNLHTIEALQKDRWNLTQQVAILEASCHSLEKRLHHIVDSAETKNEEGRSHGADAKTTTTTTATSTAHGETTRKEFFSEVDQGENGTAKTGVQDSSSSSHPVAATAVRSSSTRRSRSRSRTPPTARRTRSSGRSSSSSSSSSARSRSSSASSSVSASASASTSSSPRHRHRHRRRSSHRPRESRSRSESHPRARSTRAQERRDTETNKSRSDRTRRRHRSVTPTTQCRRLRSEVAYLAMREKELLLALTQSTQVQEQLEETIQQLIAAAREMEQHLRDEQQQREDMMTVHREEMSRLQHQQQSHHHHHQHQAKDSVTSRATVSSATKSTRLSSASAATGTGSSLKKKSTLRPIASKPLSSSQTAAALELEDAESRMSSTLASTILQLTKQLRERENTLADVRSQHAQTKAELADQLAAVTALETRLTDKTTEMRTLRNTLESRQREWSDTTQTREAHESERRRVQERVTQLETTNAELRQQLDTLTQQQNDATQKLRNELIASQQQVHPLGSENVALKNALKELELKYEHSLEVENDERQRNIALKEELRRAEIERTELQTKAHGLEKDLIKSRDQCHQLADEMKSDRPLFEQELISREKEKTTMKTHITSLEQSRMELHIQYEHLLKEKELHAHDHTVRQHDLESKLTHELNERQRLLAREHDYLDRIQKLEQANSAARDTNDVQHTRYQADLEAMREANKILEKTLDECRSELEQLSHLQVEYDLTKEELKTLRCQHMEYLDAVNQERAQWSSEKSEMQHVLDGMSDVAETGKKQLYDELEHQKSLYTDMLLKLKTRLASLSQEYDELESDYKSVQSKLADATQLNLTHADARRHAEEERDLLVARYEELDRQREVARLEDENKTNVEKQIAAQEFKQLQQSYEEFRKSHEVCIEVYQEQHTRLLNRLKRALEAVAEAERKKESKTTTTTGAMSKKSIGLGGKASSDKTSGEFLDDHTKTPFVSELAQGRLIWDMSELLSQLAEREAQVRSLQNECEQWRRVLAHANAQLPVDAKTSTIARPLTAILTNNSSLANPTTIGAALAPSAAAAMAHSQKKKPTTTIVGHGTGVISKTSASNAGGKKSSATTGVDVSNKENSLQLSVSLHSDLPPLSWQEERSLVVLGGELAHMELQLKTAQRQALNEKESAIHFEEQWKLTQLTLNETRDKLRASQKELTQLQRHTTGTIKAQEAEIAKITEALHTEEEWSSLMRAVADGKSAMKAAKEDLHRKTKQLQSAHEDVLKLKSQLEELELAVQARDAKLHKLQRAVQSKETLLTELRRKFEETEQEEKAAIDQTKDHTDKIRSLTSQVSKKEMMLKEVRHALQEKQQECDSMKDELATAQSAQSQVKKLQKRCDELATTKELCEKQKLELENQLELWKAKQQIQTQGQQS